MANGKKFRYVNTGKWDDEWHRSIGIVGRSFFDWLITSSLTNIAGIYRASLARMAFDTGIDESELKKLLARFSTDGKVHYEVAGGSGWVVMKNWLKNQELNKNQWIAVGSIFNDLPTGLQQRLTDPANELYIPFETLSKGLLSFDTVSDPSVRAFKEEPNLTGTYTKPKPKGKGNPKGKGPGAQGADGPGNGISHLEAEKKRLGDRRSM